MNRNDKRSAICRLAFLPLSQATVKEQPGEATIQVRGTFTEIPIASGEFRETGEPGNPVEQELQAAVTDTSSERLAAIRQLFSQYGLLLLTGTNGERRVVGTSQFPVAVTVEFGGSPASMTLSFSRNSPEPSKIYSSF